MAKISRLAGSASHILTVFIQDSSVATGAGLTGLAFNTAGLASYFKRNRGTTSVAVSLANITTLGTYASGGFKEIDATNLPGFYEFHPPDAAMASGSGSVAFLLRGAANMVPCPVEVELLAVDPQDAVRFGMTAVPNVVQGNAGAMPVGDASGRVTVAPAGLDAVPGIGTMNARQQADFTAAFLFSVRTGIVAGQAGTATIKSFDGSTVYGTVTYDVNGNITAVNITKANLP
jgi:hypothetical protein